MIEPTQVEALLDEALPKSPAERAAFLEHACEGNRELRQEVERLLAAHPQAEGFLDRPALNNTAALGPQAEVCGTIIGPYKLLEQIGEGGMGTVWLAQQTEPVKRVVALKLIKAGMDSKQFIARFEAERQALALMDHPHIAKVFDGGTTSGGRPYFVMDLVKGVPITQYCDEHHLTPRQRLELFIPICHAIQHAHQKGIIHRDLKPSNVLVALYDPGAPGVPKVIDFGVAKAAGQPLTEQTLVTGFGGIVGTLEYMSPEQAEINQLDIDTRSDIYALGVLLYELLTGSPPFTRKELEKAGMLEMLRVIREQEPSKPSTKLSTAEGLPTLAANRGTEPAKLTKLVRGELDWIVMKALEKDRNRRYETANGFAMDVRRYLADEAVLACPPSAAYRLRKFARRNKRALVTAASLGAMLLVAVGTVAASIGWIMRSRAEQAVQFENDIEILLRDAHPLKDKVADLVAKPAEWKAELAARLADLQRAEASLSANAGLATPYLHARLQESRALLDREEKDRKLVAQLEDLGLPRPNDPSGVLLPDATKYAGAFREYGITIEMDPKQAGDLISQRPVPVRDLVVAGLDGWLARALTTPNPSELQWLRAVIGAADNDSWRTAVRLASAKRDRQKLEELSKSVDPAKQPAPSLVLLGRALDGLQSSQSALELMRRAQPHYPDDFWVNFQIGYFAILVRPAQYHLAARHFSVATALRPHNLTILQHLSVGLNNAGDYDGAIATNNKVIALRPDYAYYGYSGLGFANRYKGNTSAAISAYQKAVDLDIEEEGVVIALIDLLKAQGDRACVLKAAYQRLLKFQPDDLNFHIWLVVLAAEETGDLEVAIATYHKLTVRSPKSGNYFGLGLACHFHGDWAGARAAYGKAVAARPTSPRILHTIGNQCEDFGDMPTAIAGYLAAVEIAPDDPDYKEVANSHHRAGICLGDRENSPKPSPLCEKHINSQASGATRFSVHLRRYNWSATASD